VTSPDFDKRPLWTRPGFLIASVIVAVIVFAGVGIALLPSPGRNHTPAARGTPTDGPTTGNVAESPADPGPTTVPTVAPQGVTWQLFGQVAVPYSDSAGPRRVTTSTASGYAHTPIGALIAAAQISTRSGFSNGRDVWEPVVTEQFVPSADRDRLLGNLRNTPPEPARPGELSQPAGFIYQSYTQDTAVIGLVDRAPSRTNAPAYFIATVTMLWKDGDWRMVAPPGGSWLSVNREANDLTGVVEWGPH
jgi:hypothetical protein